VKGHINKSPREGRSMKLEEKSTHTVKSVCCAKRTSMGSTFPCRQTASLLGQWEGSHWGPVSPVQQCCSPLTFGMKDARTEGKKGG
jgi:hypothetical protein